MFEVVNRHTRTLPVELSQLQEMLQTLATPQDAVWPHRHWPPMRFREGLREGADGGHGPVRYRVISRAPDAVVFGFTQHQFWKGTHRFYLEQTSSGVKMHHLIEARLTLVGWALWHLAIGCLHDALVEDAFDGIEQATTGRPSRRHPWSLRVRVLRRLFGLLLR